MKPPFCSLLAAACVAFAISPAHADPDLGALIVRTFGEAQAKNIVLIKATATVTEPVQWTVYSRDPYRPGEQLRTIVTLDGATWKAEPAGAGRLLQRTPPRPIDFKRVKYDSKHARGIATQAAGLAKAAYVTAAMQLAANEITGAPEWGLALQDGSGYEIGFCIVSAETGALTHQDWTPKPVAGAAKTPLDKGEQAARKVKQGVRKAWNWTEEAGRTTGNFFRELFR